VLNVFTIQALFSPRKTRRVLEKQDSGDKASVLLDKMNGQDKRVGKFKKIEG
jgi:hypothetical protein